MRLFDINPIMLDIQTALEAGTEPNPDAIALLIAEGPEAINDWVSAIREVEGQVATLKSRESEIKGRREAREQTIERMKNALQSVIQVSFEGKIKTAENTVWVQTVPKHQIEIENLNAVPSKYIRTEKTLDKALVKTDFKNGVAIDGLVITTTQEPSLRIKT